MHTGFNTVFLLLLLPLNIKSQSDTLKGELIRQYSTNTVRKNSFLFVAAMTVLIEPNDS